MSLTSFIEVSQDSHFPIQNLPYGIFSTAEKVKLFGTLHCPVLILSFECLRLNLVLVPPLVIKSLTCPNLQKLVFSKASKA